MRYKVIKEYKDVPDKPIMVREGEILQFIKESDPRGDWPNWMFCRATDKEGWIPRQILDIDDSRVICKCDYSAREHILRMNDLLIAEKILNGWIWSHKEGETAYAWAPLNHLEKIENNQ